MPPPASATRGRSCLRASASAARKRCWARTRSLPGAARWAAFTRPRWRARAWGGSRIIDRDYVEPTNLHRQWLFEESDAAEALPKAAAAARRLRAINSSVEVRAVVADLTAANAAELLGGADVILDGTDNFETRFLINDFAVSRGIPWIYGAAVGSYGLTMPVIPGRTACLRCVYPAPPAGAQPTCETAGILNAVVSAVASLQVADALKILCGQRRRGARAHHHHRRLGGRHPADRGAAARPRLPRLRARRISVPGGIGAGAGHAVRAQRRAGARARPARSTWNCCARAWRRWAKSAPTNSRCASRFRPTR